MFHEFVNHGTFMTGKKGMIQGEVKEKCSKCDKLKEIRSKRYCRKCSSEYMKEWRKTHPLTDEARFKSNVRTKLRMRVKRGMMEKQSCEICGKEKVEAHHPDYNKPYDVIWYCSYHHREHHKSLKGLKHDRN